MPIHCPVPTRLLSQEEFGALSYEVMADVFAIRNELGRFFDEVIYSQMRSLTILVGLVLIHAEDGFGQGSLTYRTTLGVGKEKYIFLPDPSAPTIRRMGVSLPDYAGFARMEGTGYYAELWWAHGEGQPESSLKPVPGSLVTFGTGATAGLINGKSKLDIPGTFGGEKVTLQLRAWNNQGNTVSPWALACEPGMSNLFMHELAGLDQAGNPQPGSGSIANGLEYFSFVLCPEPSAAQLGLLGLLMIAITRRRRA